MTSVQSLTTWSEKAMNAMRASPAKAAVMIGLLLIMVVAWIRVLAGGHTNPATAQAAAVPPARTAPQLSDDSAPYHSSTDSGPTIQQWARQQPQPLKRNPFIVPMDFYASDGAKTADSASAGGYWNQVGKSMSSRADQQEQRQILVDNVLIAAEALKLESTIMGATPGAMINGQLVAEGSEIEGFRVLKIEPRQIIVEREGVKLAVMMN